MSDPSKPPESPEKAPGAPVTGIKSTAEEIVQRHTTLLKAMAYGRRLPTNIIKELAPKIPCSESTLWKDWRSRRRWAPKILELDTRGSENAVIDMFNSMDLVEENLMEIGLDDKNQKAFTRIVALNNLSLHIERNIKLRQDLGMLTRAPTELEVRSLADAGSISTVLKELRPLIESKGQQLLVDAPGKDDLSKPVHTLPPV